MYQGKNWDYAAGILWPVLVQAASNGRRFFYSDLSPLIDTNPLNVGKALGPIQDFCLDHDLPPLTVLVIGKASKVPGSGFIAWDIEDLEQAMKLVFAENWSAIENPYGHFGPDDSRESLADRLLKAPDTSGEIYRHVRDRGVAQRIFKAALSEAYDHSCAFCGMTFTAALEGAHIIPWSMCTPEQKLDVRNGILLCATHHRLFDQKCMGVRADFRIQHSDPEGEDEPYSEIDTALSIQLHGKLMRLPKNPSIRPSAELIAKRWKADGWDGE
ncbi:HNH endonuclease [Lacibacterium aquatile]|uniref:HNH endonuclease n=1 Tax=Lacibacterium aquatile TaxID=1168082 RepID=A0ABW5DU67_9PROT